VLVCDSEHTSIPDTPRIGSKVNPERGRFGGRAAELSGGCRKFSEANLPLGPYGSMPHIVELSPIERNRNYKSRTPPA
jgi:hypothetical protein